MACYFLQTPIYSQDKKRLDDFNNKDIMKNDLTTKVLVSDNSMWTVTSDGSVNLKLVNQYSPPAYWTFWVWPKDLWLNCSSGTSGRFAKLTVLISLFQIRE